MKGNNLIIFCYKHIVSVPKINKTLSRVKLKIINFILRNST
nr:MAG TPA: hypothetical protein [Caudoviricetes sp.]